MKLYEVEGRFALPLLRAVLFSDKFEKKIKPLLNKKQPEGYQALIDAHDELRLLIKKFAQKLSEYRKELSSGVKGRVFTFFNLATGGPPFEIEGVTYTREETKNLGIDIAPFLKAKGVDVKKTIDLLLTYDDILKSSGSGDSGSSPTTSSHGSSVTDMYADARALANFDDPAAWLTSFLGGTTAMPESIKKKNKILTEEPKEGYYATAYDKWYKDNFDPSKKKQVIDSIIAKFEKDLGAELKRKMSNEKEKILKGKRQELGIAILQDPRIAVMFSFNNYSTIEDLNQALVINKVKQIFSSFLQYPPPEEAKENIHKEVVKKYEKSSKEVKGGEDKTFHLEMTDRWKEMSDEGYNNFKNFTSTAKAFITAADKLLKKYIPLWKQQTDRDEEQKEIDFKMEPLYFIIDDVIKNLEGVETKIELQEVAFFEKLKTQLPKLFPVYRDILGLLQNNFIAQGNKKKDQYEMQKIYGNDWADKIYELLDNAFFNLYKKRRDLFDRLKSKRTGFFYGLSRKGSSEIGDLIKSAIENRGSKAKEAQIPKTLEKIKNALEKHFSKKVLELAPEEMELKISFENSEQVVPKEGPYFNIDNGKIVFSTIDLTLGDTKSKILNRYKDQVIDKLKSPLKDLEEKGEELLRLYEDTAIEVSLRKGDPGRGLGDTELIKRIKLEVDRLDYTVDKSKNLIFQIEAPLVSFSNQTDRWESVKGSPKEWTFSGDKMDSRDTRTRVFVGVGLELELPPNEARVRSTNFDNPEDAGTDFGFITYSLKVAKNIKTQTEQTESKIRELIKPYLKQKLKNKRRIS